MCDVRASGSMGHQGTSHHIHRQRQPLALDHIGQMRAVAGGGGDYGSDSEKYCNYHYSNLPPDCECTGRSMWEQIDLAGRRSLLLAAYCLSEDDVTVVGDIRYYPLYLNKQHCSMFDVAE